MAQFNYVAPFNRTGYGIAAVGYADGLSTLYGESDFTYKCIGDPDIHNPELKSKVHLLERMKESDSTLPSLIFWHLHDVAQYLGDGPNIGFTTFEVDGFRPPEREVVSKLAALGTASEWGANVLKLQFPDFEGEIFHAPHAYRVVPSDTLPEIRDTDPVLRWQELLGPQIPEGTFVISNCGKFEKRKGHMLLLDVLKECVEPTLLVGFWHNPFIYDGYHFSELHQRGFRPVETPSQIKLFRWKSSYVALMPPTPSRQELHGALGTAHTYISPSFAEGWDLPLFEMMSYGMHCCTAGTTGQSEYADETNCVIIDSPEYTVPARDGYFFNGQGGWLELDKTAVLKALEICRAQHFDSNGKNAVQKLRAKSRQDTSQFTWMKSAKVLQNVLNKVGATVETS